MKHRFPFFHRTIVTACLLSIALPLSAQNLTLEQAQELRKDAGTAQDALERITPDSDADAVRQDVLIAGNAVDRINAQLDAYIAQFQHEEEDIYGGGKKYPPSANVTLGEVDVPIGATEVHIPVMLDRESPNTVIAYVRVFDGQGGRADPDKTKAVIFYPGDPLTKTVSFNISSMSEGNNVRANQPSVPDGANRKGDSLRITAKEGAVNEPIADTGREGTTFQPLGTLVFSETGQTIRFDDKGGPNSFSTSLSHGRTQVGNGETGFYGTVDMGGFKRSGEDLVLSSRRLDQPVKVGSPATEYPFLAVMLSGHNTPETYFKYGSVEWVVKMPNRRGSWPALWLLPTGGWPPEIDVYEGFGYNGSWKFNSDLSTNLHGGDRNQRTFTRPAMYMSMKVFDLPGTLDTEFHKFAVTVEPEWITMFVDDKETMRYANPFQGETWYPLTNVAVKAKPDSAYDDGSGDMTLRSLKIWRAE